MQPQPPFQNWSLTERNQRTLAPGSFDLWRVGGAVLTESQTLTSATYGQLPYTRLQLSANTTLPPYTQDVWDRTRNSGASISFFVFIQNTDVNQITISPGTGWTFVAYQISAGCACLLLVLDNGMGAIGVPMSPAAGVAGSFTVSTTGPLTATSPVNLGGNLALNNTALESIATNNWKAGTGSTFTASRVNSVAIGHGITGAGSNAVNVGYLSLVGNDGVALGANTIASAQSVAVGGGAQTASGNSVAMGYLSSAGGLESISIGVSSSNAGQRAIAIGYQSSSSATNAIALGASANASNTTAIAIGQSAQALRVGSIIIGDGATCGPTIAQTDNIAIGSRANSNGGIAIGADSSASTGMAIGRSALCAYSHATSVGDSTDVRSESTALGYHARAVGEYSSAIGSEVLNSVDNTSLIGNMAHPSPTEHTVLSTGYLRSRNLAGMTAVVPLQTMAVSGAPTSGDRISFVQAYSGGGVELDPSNPNDTEIILPSYTDANAWYLVSLGIFGPVDAVNVYIPSCYIAIQLDRLVNHVLNVTAAEKTNQLTGLDTTHGFSTYTEMLMVPAGVDLHTIRFRIFDQLPGPIATPYCRGYLSITRIA